MKRYTIGIDIGTTAVKGVLLDRSGRAVAWARQEQHQYYPQPGWVEQDPEELLALVCDVAKQLMQKAAVTAEDVLAIGLDHQGESCLVWDRESGKALYPVITWQDRRMSAPAEDYKRSIGAQVREKTGLTPDSYYSALKFSWLLDHIPQGRTLASEGKILGGTLDSWIIWKLTSGRSFVTDVCSAGCTMLCNIHTGCWDPWLLELFSIPRVMLPEIMPCDVCFGTTDEGFFGGPIPIQGVAPDGHMGMFGIDGVKQGTLTVTYGTGSFMHLVTGPAAKPERGLTVSRCCARHDEKVYQINGICYTAGTAVKWLQNGLGILEDDRQSAEIARSVPDSGGVIFVPAFTGLAMPWWDQEARGALLGLTAGVTRAHVVRAVLESLAAQVATNLEIMRQSCQGEISCIYALGGITANDFLMQYQADLAGLPVIIPHQTEPCFGAAKLAMISCLGEQPWQENAGDDHRVFYPTKSENWRKSALEFWNQGVARCLSPGNSATAPLEID